MDTVLSEFPLSPDYELHVDGEALWVEGVGCLGQYHSYLDTFWEKGVAYFIRDHLQSNAQLLDHLNSKIRVYEEQCRLGASHN